MQILRDVFIQVYDPCPMSLSGVGAVALDRWQYGHIGPCGIGVEWEQMQFSRGVTGTGVAFLGLSPHSPTGAEP